MGSLVPGWENNHEPDFREMSKPHEEEVPEWLQKVRAEHAEKESQQHHAHATDSLRRKSMQRPILARTSLTQSPPSSTASVDGFKSGSLPLKAGATPTDVFPEDEEEDASDGNQIKWWKKLESSRYNDKPDAEKPSDYKNANYIPQYDIARQHLSNKTL